MSGWQFFSKKISGHTRSRVITGFREWSFQEKGSKNFKNHGNIVQNRVFFDKK
jgi:hypothetical protein